MRSDVHSAARTQHQALASEEEKGETRVLVVIRSYGTLWRAFSGLPYREFIPTRRSARWSAVYSFYKGGYQASRCPARAICPFTQYVMSQQSSDSTIPKSHIGWLPQCWYESSKVRTAIFQSLPAEQEEHGNRVSPVAGQKKRMR